MEPMQQQPVGSESVIGQSSEQESIQPAPPMPEQTPAPAPIDSVTAILLMPAEEAIQKVYQVSVSAARNKGKLDDAADRMDARQYHDLMSKYPEVQYAQELIAARRRLDELAQERRRINFEIETKGYGNGVLEMQSTAVSMAMEQVAKGVLLFLSLPQPPSTETLMNHEVNQTAKPPQPTEQDVE